MRARFGSDRLGLQTGDISLNNEADITIMTTEILRNIMYRIQVERQRGGDATSAAASTSLPPAVATQMLSGGSSARLDDVGLIVLDEVHYLGDPYRRARACHSCSLILQSCVWFFKLHLFNYSS